jgi:hypothetical protein
VAHFTQTTERPRTLPRRVIDVGTEGHENVRLIDFGDNPPQGNYLCLSHLWAQSNPLTTKMSTLTERKEGILLDKLSRTLRDAILLTRAFEHRYIWIDSLCILQDSHSDWDVESSKMGAYYYQSWLTIGAGGSADPSTGILGKRYPRVAPDPAFYQLPLARDDGELDLFYFTGSEEVENRGGDKDRKSMLYTRGW